jgi:diguanylate cyclase (GGDEF)-like protein
MPAAVAHHPRLLKAASIVCFLSVGAALFWVEVPGLGIAHLIYLPVAFMALATSPRAGGLAGLSGTLGYLALGVLSPRLGSPEVLTVSTLVIAMTSIAFGVLIGWFSASNRRLMAQMHELAKRDFLTGLLNMRAFEDSLAARCERPHPFAVLLADLDGLKVVNDGEGHHAGNVLLRRAADALTEDLRDEDDAARVGGDEFALIVGAMAAPDDAEATARRLERRLERRGLWLSFGWAVYPADATNAVELFRRADQRLYSSKLARATGRERTAPAPATKLASAAPVTPLLSPAARVAS